MRWAGRGLLPRTVFVSQTPGNAPAGAGPPAKAGSQPSAAEQGPAARPAAPAAAPAAAQGAWAWPSGRAASQPPTRRNTAAFPGGKQQDPGDQRDSLIYQFCIKPDETVLSMTPIY